MDVFNIEDQWKLYMQKMGMVESRLSPIQLSETKKAFIGGISQMLLIMRNDLAKLTDEQAIGKLENMFNQVNKFWMITTNSAN